MMDMINEMAFDFIYNEAMDDATRRTNAASIKDKVLKCKDAKIVLFEYAKNVIVGKNPCFYEYENRFENEISKVGISGFTFGNIQKLINMTMKYLYIRYYDGCRENFGCCHAPMDSRMIEIVGKMYSNITGENLGISECAWSKIEKGSTSKNNLESYKKYQEGINKIINEKNMFPIEFDFYMWGQDPKKKDELVLPQENMFV